MTVTIRIGDCRELLKAMPDESVHCVVTSPPYWRQRDYDHIGQIGMELEPGEYTRVLTAVFAEARRVLRRDGVCWVNLGDKWASGGNGGGGSLAKKRGAWRQKSGEKGWRGPPAGYKDKDLTLIAFKVAESMRADGWYLRKTIIWSKPAANEPPRLDRPSISHEYLFMFSKENDSRARSPGEDWWHSSVWLISHAEGGDHPAMMPAELARRCIVSSTSAGDVVLDPFGGAGTTALAADQSGRNAILFELNPEYTATAEKRLRADGGMFIDVQVAA